MSLNIKDQEVYRLAQAISHVTGETLTAAVREALRERHGRLQSLRNRPSVEDLLAIGRRASAELKGTYEDHATLLYHDNGLPK